MALNPYFVSGLAAGADMLEPNPFQRFFKPRFLERNTDKKETKISAPKIFTVSKTFTISDDSSIHKVEFKPIKAGFTA